jgi:hypothetical protein
MMHFAFSGVARDMKETRTVISMLTNALILWKKPLWYDVPQFLAKKTRLIVPISSTDTQARASL